MSAEAGPGRRLTPAEEERAAGLYRGGASTRDVARELAISNSSAQRVRVRLRDAGRLTPLPAETPSSEVVKREDPGESTVTEHDDQADAAENSEVLPATGDAAELAQLTAQREAVAAEVILQVERAEASLQAVQALETERVQALAEGRDAQSLRGRRRDADDDARDFADAATLAHGRLDRLDQQIAAVQQRIMTAALGAELAEAIKDRDAVLAKTGGRQRAAVLAVRTAAEEFTAAIADERAAIQRVDQLAMQIALGGPMPDVPPAVPTALQTPPDVNAPLPFTQAMYAAGRGETKRVAALLGEVFGWLPPTPPELEAQRAETRERIEAMRQAQQPARPAPPQPAVHMDPRYGASHGVDAHGNALPPSLAELERRQPEQRRPAGWLGGQPFPG